MFQHTVVIGFSPEIGYIKKAIMGDMLIEAAKREMDERAARRRASGSPALLRTDATAYSGPARIRSINTSPHKGTRKTPVPGGVDRVIEQFGLESDAHAGHWHRQVSLLTEESIRTAQARGLNVKDGDFGENVTTEGIDLHALPLGTLLRLGPEVLIEISQIGKVCHTRCAIYYLAGDCIFPHEGIFGVVLHGGEIHVDDVIEIERLGSGTCTFTPPEALAEVEQAKRDGTL